MSSPSQQRGYRVETAALDYLRHQGLRLLARNYSCRHGEIDLVMRHRSSINRNILVFVEVRYRRSNQYGSAAASVGTTKQRRLQKTAEHYCQRHPLQKIWPARFDIVAVSGSLDNPCFSWLAGAFEC
ncbi:MAG: YraN family protein [Pseudomonadota bacterium]